MLNAVTLLAQSNGNGGGFAGGGCFAVVWLVVLVVVLAGCWKVFVKAGQPGWAAIVPIYNMYILLQIIGKPIWWLILFFIPFVNVVIGIIVCIELAKRFGKGVGFGIGLALLGFIFFPILGFGDAQYMGANS